MKKRIVFVLLSVLLLGLFAPAAEARIVWLGKGKQTEEFTFGNTPLHNETDIVIRHYYKSGVRENGTRVSMPIKTFYGYYYQGNSLDCDGIASMIHIDFNSYFNDNNGRNFNPTMRRLSCQRDGWNEKVDSYDDDEANTWLSHADGRPRYKTNVHLSWNNFPDQKRGTGGYFSWMGLPLRQII